MEDKEYKEMVKAIVERENALLKAIEEDKLYDYITNEGYKWEKDKLIEIIIELDYAIYRCCLKEEREDIRKELIENLKDKGYGEEDNE